MQRDISDYRVTHRIALGDSLKVFFQSTTNPKDVRVLELRGVAGYLDYLHKCNLIASLRVDEAGGSYNLDLSMRLRRPEIKRYPEVFVFGDHGMLFRAVAAFVDFRPKDEDDDWLREL